MMTESEQPVPPPLSELDLRRKLNKAEKDINDLLVVIDTAQAALRRAESSIPEDLKGHVFNASAKWVLNYRWS